MIISIHAPRGGRHIGLPVTTLRAMAFQSTLPVGGATFHLPHSLFLLSISIHAPRRRSDICIIFKRLERSDFNPRSPQGERLPALPTVTLANISIHAPRRGSDLHDLLPVSCHMISIHAPRRGSDMANDKPVAVAPISIHAPRRGSDDIVVLRIKREHNFNPRSPQGERPANNGGNLPHDIFQSTLPAGGATFYR